MGNITFITGGARSGKSLFAEQKALASGREVLYIATALAFDQEMEERIRLHRQRRPDSWQTLEAYRGLAGLLRDKTGTAPLLLLDCLTVMVTNLLLEQNVPDWDTLTPDQGAALEQLVEQEVDDFLGFCASYQGETLVVSNELGMGLVPPTPLGRYFRDIQGRMNQKAAARAHEAYFLVSGLALKLK